MNDYFLELFTKYRKYGILIDTNILLLFVVGSMNPDLIPRVSRTANFSFQDFQIVEKAIDFFDKKITTTHILTEVSDLIDREEIQEGFRSYIEMAVEQIIGNSQVIRNEMFSKFGLTDAAIL